MKTNWKRKALCAAAVALCAAAAPGAVPVEWSVDVGEARPTPRQFTAYRGETLLLSVSFHRRGNPEGIAGDVALMWQTNGMGERWWTAAAAAASNVVTAAWTPTNDCGAAVYSCFIGSPGTSYRAAFQLRLLHSPGAVPNEVPLPARMLDFAEIEVQNPPWKTNGVDAATVASIVETATSDIPRIGESLVYPHVARHAEDAYHADMASAAEYAWKADWTTKLAGRTQSPRDGDDIFGQIDKSTSDITTLGSQLNTIASTLNAEDAKFEVTNYNSQVHMPEASFSVKVKNEQTGSNEWVIAWRELTRWNWFLGEVWDPCTNALWAALGNKSEKEYAFYDGVTGEPAPDGFFWIAQPRIAICAGMSYQRYVDGEGAIWVLESNGMIADLNGTTNGFFRITDEENNVQFEIIKGNRRTLGAAPRTMKQEVMGVTHFFTSYATTNAVAPPVAKFCRDIGVQTPKWYAESDQDCPMNASWTDKGSGIYEVEWWQKSSEPSMFLVAEYESGGATRIVQRAPVEMQKLYIGGVEYTIGTATIDGKTVLTLTP